MAKTRLLLAFFLSGSSGLVYEVVWSRRLAVLVGGTAHATQAVLATFFAGVTLGAFWLGRRAAAAPDGRRFYARLELGIAAAGALSAVVLHAAEGLVAALTDGSDGPATAAVALAVTAITCLPATVLMGATFAGVARALGGPDGLDRAGDGDEVGGLLGRAYAANTIGAVAGSLGAAFALLPALGVRGTMAAAVVGNLVAAALAGWRPSRGAAPAHPPAPPPPSPAAAAERLADPASGAQPPRIAGPLAFGLAASGFAAILLEVVALRVLAVTLHDTVYTFAVAVAAYICGAALTSAFLGRRPRLLALRPPVALALATLASALWLPTLRLGAPIGRLLSGEGGGFLGAVSAEAGVALALALPAAIPTTWVFLTLAAHAARGSAAVGAGKATAWNGVGCALAPLVSSLVVLPATGSTFVLAGVALGSLALAALLLLARDRGRVVLVAGALAAAAVPAFLVRDGLFTWWVTPGWHLLWAREGASAAVSIEESPPPQRLRRLRTNNTFGEGGDAGGVSQTRQGMLPTLFRPDARRALMLGVGSGITLGGAVAGAPRATFDAVELLPEIERGISAFDRTHGGVGRDPRVRLHVADARSFAAHAAARGDRYDLVLGELFHAAQAGTGALYAREHFGNVRRLLSPGGVYCQWVPLHEAPPREVRTIVRTFYRVFPHGAALLGTWTVLTPILGLCGAESPQPLRWQEAAAIRGSAPGSPALAARAEVDRTDETLAAFLADAAEMRAWAGPGRDNTDDEPVLELGAPRGLGPTLGADNLVALLPVRRPPDGMTAYEGDLRDALLAFQRATAAFIRGMHSWIKDDLAAALPDLAAACRDAPRFAPVRQALADLATDFARRGNPASAARARAALGACVAPPPAP